jgi:propane monooxygenase small subunit
MHPEHGLGMHVFIPAQRDAPTNMINNAISVNAMHKLRIAQDLALFNLEVSEVLDDFDGQAHLEAWSKDEAWQPVRENVEQLTAVRDWLEATVATNLVFEPLVGELFRSSFVMSSGAANGDFVTPVIMGVAEHDFDRDLAYTQDLVGPLVSDEQHADHNRGLIEGWLGTWAPLSVAAARSLEPLWSEPERTGETFDQAFDRARGRARGIFDELGLKPPEEIN